MELIYYPNEFLRKKTPKVEKFDEVLFKQIKEMFKIMKNENGIGLAANQVGIDKSFFVMNIPFKELELKRIFINPEIKLSGKLISTKEGCLSFPGICVEVGRNETCELKYQNLSGVECTEVFTGLPAIVCQHENDHLNGKTFIDYLTKEQQDKILEKLKV